MKQFLKKPLGLAVAATMAIGGMAAFTNASATTDANALGDLALVPYYTVRDNFVTGVHVTNTSNMTQVVKFRLRRGSDSADALDFNVILSPYDMWTGTINDDSGQLGITSTDKSCTAPAANGVDSLGRPKFVAPATFAAGGAADEGYLEVIGMAQADAAQTISMNALHVNGVPVSCDLVRENFLATNVLTNATTRINSGTVSTYTETANALKVSYFVRDAASGMEMGDNATHIADFATTPMMTNQQTGLNSGDVNGFDFPDLDGGGANAGNRGRYDAVIRDPALGLGAASILNDWSFKASNGVSTDWVVTIPGQYLMDNPTENGSIIVNGLPAAADTVNHRDIPATANFAVYDREEGTATPGGLVISPSPQDASTTLSREVNVIEWGGQKVFNTVAPTTVVPTLASGASSGWANLSITTNTAAANLQIFDQSQPTNGTGVVTTKPAPIIGFTGWQRTFTDASKNYGRIVGHSRR